MDNAGKRKGSDSDSYDEEDGVEGGFQIIGSEAHDVSLEKDLIAASKVTTQVCNVLTCQFVNIYFFTEQTA